MEENRDNEGRGENKGREEEEVKKVWIGKRI